MNIAVAANRHFIREIDAHTGSTPDAQTIVPTLINQQIHHDLLPQEFGYDQAAGYGKTIADIEAATGGATRLIVKPIQLDQRQPQFTPRDFTLDENGDSLVCPNGKRTWKKYRSGSGDGFNFRFMPSQCQACPLLQKCRPDASQPASPRNVFLSDYQITVQKALAFTQTTEFKMKMKQRSDIERVIAILTNRDGARQARFRGVDKCDYQAKMCGMAFNLKAWMNILRQQEKGIAPREPALPNQKRWRVWLKVLGLEKPPLRTEPKGSEGNLPRVNCAS